LRKFFVSLTYDFLLIARNSQARHKSGVRFFVNRALVTQKLLYVLHVARYAITVNDWCPPRACTVIT